MSVSEEVRSRCHLKHRATQYSMTESASNESISGELSQSSTMGVLANSCINQTPALGSSHPPPGPCTHNAPGFHSGQSQLTSSSFPGTGITMNSVPSPQVTCPHSSSAPAGQSSPPQTQGAAPIPPPHLGASPPCPPLAIARRQKSWDLLDQNAVAAARMQKNTHMSQSQVGIQIHANLVSNFMSVLSCTS